MAAELIESNATGVEMAQPVVAALGETSLAEVVKLPASTSLTNLYFYDWVRCYDAAGHGPIGVAEYKRDEQGLYVDQHGEKVYLAD